MATPISTNLVYQTKSIHLSNGKTLNIYSNGSANEPGGVPGSGTNFTPNGQGGFTETRNIEAGPSQTFQLSRQGNGFQEVGNDGNGGHTYTNYDQNGRYSNEYDIDKNGHKSYYATPFVLNGDGSSPLDRPDIPALFKNDPVGQTQPPPPPPPNPNPVPPTPQPGGPPSQILSTILQLFVTLLSLLFRGGSGNQGGPIVPFQLQ